jgi:UDP-N-acetylglucosamine/UDP-N-acetylgalactosamine diphosphorylase
MNSELHKRLEKVGQEHLLRFKNELTDEQQKSLVAQIEAIDFPALATLYGKKNQASGIEELAQRAKSPSSVFTLGKGNADKTISPESAIAKGCEALDAGQVAVVLVAGGQGTRLGFDHPKGMYPVGPVSDSTLFKILAEKIVALGRRHGRTIPFCIMTSHATHAVTIEYFEANDRFGIAPEDLLVFSQGTMPAVDLGSGRVLLTGKDAIAKTPDGHGGMLAAFDSSSVLGQLEQRGVKHAFYLQVDNALVDVGSPEFLGYHILSGSEYSCQAIEKGSPEDKVGNLVSIDERLNVIEYSDLPKAIAERRNLSDGSLEISSGSIGVHIFDIPFLRRMADTTDSLPFHIAEKKVPYLDENGTHQSPETPNAIKFERFIFDLLPQAEKAIVVQVDPSDHFAPLKNADDKSETDTPSWVRDQLIAFAARRLREAGVEVAEGVPVEISPLYALDVEELREKVSPGMKIDTPTYLH